MKTSLMLIMYSVLFFSCEKHDMFRSETDERFAILKEEITSMPPTPINFYWEPTAWDSAKTLPVTSCSTEEIQFDYPYIIANGIKFHAYYWSRTQNKLGGHTLVIESMLIAFNHEK